MAPASAAPISTAGSLRPTEGPGELPKIVVPAAPAVPAVGLAPVAEGEAAAALDLNMGPSVHGMVRDLLAPAGAASGAHATEVAAVKAATETGFSQLRIDTKLKQETVATATDQHVADLHRDWGTQR